MHIAVVGSEAAPWLKTGGLGDVLGALPTAVARRGHAVTLILPCHRGVRAALKSAVKRTPIEVRTLNGTTAAAVEEVSVSTPGVRILLIDHPPSFERSGPYNDAAGRDFADNSDRYAFFCRAALAAASALDLKIDCFHAHDWPTGLLPAYLRTPLAGRYANTPSVFTIHNLAYQGNFSFDRWGETLLDRRLMSMDGLEFYGQFSHLKAGILFADVITTVSPTYAKEIQQSDFGCRMDGLLRYRAHRLRGIINGIDMVAWNPATDTLLDVNYDASSWRTGRADNKRFVRDRAGLNSTPADAPLVAMIGRLTEQKGFDLLAEVSDDLVARGAQLLMLATEGSPNLERPLWEVARRHPGSAAVYFAFHEPLAHQIFAAADFIVVPSRFEPCGLTQLYAMRYGAVPVVRATGGLADTVIDATPTTLEKGAATGFTFHSPSRDALGATLRRALHAYRTPQVWDSLIETGMSRDWSWDRSAAEYEKAYRDAARFKSESAGSLAS